MFFIKNHKINKKDAVEFLDSCLSDTEKKNNWLKMRICESCIIVVSKILLNPVTWYNQL